MFYVYIHRKKSDGSVFYVGKGQGSRKDHTRSRSSHWKNIVNKHGLLVDVVMTTEIESEAFDFEMLLIKEFGRKDKSEGPLVNMSDGGEGDSGRLHSEASKERIRASNVKAVAKGRRWITNGSEDRWCVGVVPAGWRLGRAGASDRANSCKRVLCLSTGDYYASAIDAAKAADCSKASMSRYCNTGKKCRKGLSWEYV